MLRDEAISLIALQLGNRTDLNATILTVLQHVQETILEGDARNLPWFLLKEDSTTTVPTGATRVALPTDFLLEEEDWCLARENADRSLTILEKDDYDFLLNKWSTASGTVEAYSLNGDYFYLFPAMAADQVLHMRYLGRDASLGTGNIQNNWLKYAADLLIAKTGEYIASRVLQNVELAARFQNDAVQAANRLYTLNEARQHAGRNYIMGGDN